MYTVSVEATFSATHRVALPDGALEPIHGHDWRVRVFLASAVLDESNMVADFEAVQQTLHSVLSRWQHRDLNEHADFAATSPTAEMVARVVYEKLRASGLGNLVRVRITERPGCIAEYEV